MQDKREPAGWQWNEGQVDRAAPHMKLYYGDWGESALPVALVGTPVGKSFPVEFLTVPALDQSQHERIKLAVMKELTFYLVQKGEKDPWKYAMYHCGTASNIYSEVHWGYFPDGSEQGHR